MKTIRLKLKAALALMAAITIVPGAAYAQQQGEINASDATVTWAFNQGVDNPTAAEVSTPEAVSATSYNLGDKLTIFGTQAANGETLTLLQPTEKVSSTTYDDSYISFMLNPKKGVSFTAKKLAFNAAKFGTDGGTMDVYAVSGDKRVTLLEGYKPLRNNAGFSSEDIDISGLGTVQERVEIVFYVYDLANNKQLGLSQIKVTGDFNGTPIEVPSYTLNVTSDMPEAGEISVNPAGNEFDEGTSAVLPWKETLQKGVFRALSLLFRLACISIPLILAMEWVIRSGLLDFWDRLVPAAISRHFPEELLTITAAQMGGLISSATVSASLMAQGLITGPQVLLAMLISSAVGNPVRTLRRNLPTALGIFPPKIACIIVFGMQLSRLLVMVAGAAILVAWMQAQG